MKQVFQPIGSGATEVAELPAPTAKRGHVLVRNRASLVSAGTERTIVDFAGKNLAQKARERPDLVRQVLQAARQRGLLSTLDLVRSGLDTRIALGYSSAGTVIEVGDGAGSHRVGDLVACAGAGYAVHSEIVSVPANLVAAVPEGVDPEHAAFTTVGCIAMHGLRLGTPQLGETVAVIGLGLVGQLVVQLAKAAGCTVVGMDLDGERCRLAEQLGCDAAADSEAGLHAMLGQHTTVGGCDLVIIAAGTNSSGPVRLAGEIARDRGRVVAVGAVGMELPRDLYFAKELDFVVSRSYGPGRYDPGYEEKGADYPAGYVRWTENRNMVSFCQLLGDGKVNVGPLISHRFPIADAAAAYALIQQSDEPYLGVLITYPQSEELERRIDLGAAGSVAAPPAQQGAGPEIAATSPVKQPRLPITRVQVGLVGAGAFAQKTLLPAARGVDGLDWVGVCSSTGKDARVAGDKFGFRYCTSDPEELFGDDDVNTIAIATRHDLHASLAAAALRAGKHVFVEKPPALNRDELGDLVSAVRQAGPQARFMVGYNRRFAPLAQQLGAFVEKIDEPLIIAFRVNAGFIAPNHWVHDAEQGGGRILGEVCHFVDFIGFLAGAAPTSVFARCLPNNGKYVDDNVQITLELAGGSIGSITYVANGDPALPKERIEVYGGGRAAVLDDFRRLELVERGRSRISKSRFRQDKGHRGEWLALANELRGVTTNGDRARGDTASEDKASLPTLQDIVGTSLATFGTVESIRSGAPIALDPAGFIAAEPHATARDDAEPELPSDEASGETA